MAGINSGNPLGQIRGVNGMTQRRTAESLGVSRGFVTALKSGRKSLSPEMAKRLAALTGEKAGNLFVESALHSLKSRIANQTIDIGGAGRSVAGISMKSSGEFRPGEFDRSSPQLGKALEELREIAEEVLDLLPDGDEGEGEPTVATATKSGESTGGVARDFYGRRMG